MENYSDLQLNLTLFSKFDLDLADIYQRAVLNLLEIILDLLTIKIKNTYNSISIKSEIFCNQTS